MFFMERNLLEKKVSDGAPVSQEGEQRAYSVKPFALNYLKDPSTLPVDYMETGTTVRDITQKDD